jgi:hypothetical protein
MAGLILDPWEQFVLAESLGERRDGKWAAFEVGLVVPRQNGKDAILEARELAGLFLLGEQLIVHSAHEFATAMEHMRRVEMLLEGSRDLTRRVKNVKKSHGEEGIELKNGQRMRFRTRTKGGLRGFTGDLIIFNEAMILPSASHGAILPTLSAKSILGNPQVWYTASPVDEWIHEHGFVLTSLRERGIAGDDPALAYFEWSEGAESPDDVGDRATNPESWARSNPGLGIRISAEHIEREQRSMDSRTFAVERLGVGAWPSLQDEAEELIDAATWTDDEDPDSKVLDPIALAIDVSPDRSKSSIGCSGKRSDGLGHVEVLANGEGTGWVVARTVELVVTHGATAVVVDGKGPAASLVEQLDAKLPFEVTVMNTTEYVQACGSFYDAAIQKAFRHIGQPSLNAALQGAAQRNLGEAWAWSRKSSNVDITPLVAVTLARWEASRGEEESVWERRAREADEAQPATEVDAPEAALL